MKKISEATLEEINLIIDEIDAFTPASYNKFTLDKKSDEIAGKGVGWFLYLLGIFGRTFKRAQPTKKELGEINALYWGGMQAKIGTVLKTKIKNDTKIDVTDKMTKMIRVNKDEFNTIIDINKSILAKSSAMVANVITEAYNRIHELYSFDNEARIPVTVASLVFNLLGEDGIIHVQEIVEHVINKYYLVEYNNMIHLLTSNNEAAE